MKYLGVVLAALLFGASAGQAAQVRFRIALRGTVQTAQGVTTLTDQSLVSMSGNALVLMLDVDAGVVAIEEWNSSLTTEIDRDPVLSGTQALMENFRMATITGRGSQFMANLEMVDVDWNHDGVEDTGRRAVGTSRRLVRISTPAR